MIRYLAGDATAPRGDEPELLVHVCNDVGKWGKGFVLAISRRWKQPENSFHAWHRGETSQRFALGEVQFVQVAPTLWIANLVGQHGVASKQRRDPPIRYGAQTVKRHIDPTRWAWPGASGSGAEAAQSEIDPDKRIVAMLDGKAVAKTSGALSESVATSVA
jgi:hypothetical protein